MPLPLDHPDWLQIRECYRALRKGGSNVVWEILRQSEPFKQWDHYPKGDVFDKDTCSQYYYHAHPRMASQHPVSEENGHFHLFLRKAGIPAEIQPIEVSRSCKPENSKDDEVCHLISISMDNQGYPLRLFTTNRWVSGENWYAAKDVVRLINYFNIDHTYPSWPLNLWLSSMIRVYQEEITTLIYARDEAMTDWQKNHPDKNVYEDRQFEIPSHYDFPSHERAKHISP